MLTDVGMTRLLVASGAVIALALGVCSWRTG